MGKTFRYIARGAIGRIRKNFNWPVIKSRQAVVHITAGEVIPGAPNSVKGPGGLVEQDFIYNLGDADIWVSNISPHFGDHFSDEPGGVEFILHVDWNEPLDVGITVTVEDNTPLGIQN
jgi:hypothetical protein